MATSDAQLPTPPPPALLPGEKRVWATEAVCLYLLAFGNSLVVSLWILLSGYNVSLDKASSAYLGFRLIAQLVSECTALALFWALMQRRDGWRILTQRPQWRDIARGIGVWVVAEATFYALFFVASVTSIYRSGLSTSAPRNIAGLDASRYGLMGIAALVLIALINPVCEECIARAWTQFHLERLYGWRPYQAALFSAALQAAYHLYQGILYAALYAVIFSGFALYYARTRRLAPVIVAHLIADVWAIGATFTAHH